MKLAIFSQNDLNSRCCASLFCQELIPRIKHLEYDFFTLDNNFNYLTFPLFEEEYSHLIFVLEDHQNNFFANRAAELYRSSKIIKIGIYLDHNFWNYRLDPFKDDQGKSRFSNEIAAEFSANSDKIADLLPRKWLRNGLSIFGRRRQLKVAFDCDFGGKIMELQKTDFKVDLNNLKKIYLAGSDKIRRREENNLKFLKDCKVLLSSELDKLPLVTVIDKLKCIDLCVGTPRSSGYGEDFYTQICLRNNLPTIVASSSEYADSLPFFNTSEFKLENLKINLPTAIKKPSLIHQLLEVLK